MSAEKRPYGYRQMELAREAGCSFEQLVRRYAAAGHSINETAHLLAYNRTALYRMCDRHGWRHLFRQGQSSIGAQRARESRRGVDTPALQACRAKRRYPTVVYQGIEDTWTGHARRLGIPQKTMFGRKYDRPGDLDYIFHTGSHVHSPDNSRHSWRENDG